MQIIPFSAGITPQLENLFQETPPIPTRLWAILDGTIRGRILVDDPVNPTATIIQDLTEGDAYLGGALTSPGLGQACAILRSYRELMVCLWPDAPLAQGLPTEPYYQGVAIDFCDRLPAVDLDRLSVIPSGYHIQRIDRDIAREIKEFDYYVTMFGSLESAVQNMIGYVLMQGETIACEAVAAPLTRGVAELGVETGEAYRQKGLATVTSAYVIRECEAMGYQAFWNAAQQNLASVALARRLGFQTERPFTVLAWSATS